MDPILFHIVSVLGCHSGFWEDLICLCVCARHRLSPIRQIVLASKHLCHCFYICVCLVVAAIEKTGRSYKINTFYHTDYYLSCICSLL